MAGRGDGVQSLGRAFLLLELMAEDGGEVPLSRLAIGSGLPLSTIHRLIRTLVARGYVRQLPSRRYVLGPRLIHLGESSDRKSTRLNSSHANISYAVFCLKKKN